MRRLVLLLIPTLALAAGCGGSKIAPVSGRVTLNGQPLANAHVSFAPIAEDGIVTGGTTSYGRTDADGRYTLRLIDPDQPGAVVGKHRILITLLNEEQATVEREDVGSVGPKLPDEPVPDRYNIESTLTFDVPPGGTDAANFDLTSP